MNKTTIDALNILSASMWVGNIFATHDGTIYYKTMTQGGPMPTRLTASRGRVRVETMVYDIDGSHWEWEYTYPIDEFEKMIELL